MGLRVVVSFDEEGAHAAAGSGGWAEVYFVGTGAVDTYLRLQSNGDLDPTCAAAVLVANRRSLLSQAYRVSHVRVTDTDPANGERSADLSTITGTGTYPLSGGSAETFAKLLLRLDCGPTRRRNLWLGGIPEEIILAPSVYNPTPTWNGKLSIFTTVLTGTYGVNGRPLKSAAQSITRFNTFDALGETVQVEPVPTGAPAGNSYCILRGIKNPRGWNGIHTMQWNSPALYVIVGPTRRSQVTVPAFVPNAKSTIQAMVPVFAGIDRVRPVRISRRKIGRPFGQGVGRR